LLRQFSTTTQISSQKCPRARVRLKGIDSSRRRKIMTVQELKTAQLTKKTMGVVATLALVISGIAGMSTPANASTAANPTIVFSGNTLADGVPATEASTRVSSDSFRLSTASLARTASTSRTGYRFGGWSLAVGEAATNEITTATTADTTRTIHAVWNTTITLQRNGADSGVPSGTVTALTYRFGQTLTLPSVGTMVKSGYTFGGWMNATVSTTRSSTYLAGSTEVGDPVLYAAWIKTVFFDANGATVGGVPGGQTYVNGATALKLPVLSEMTLRRPGYDFLGWSTTATGGAVSNPGSYIPLLSSSTMYAVWRIQASQGSTRIFFKPGKAGLRASEKLQLRDLVDALKGKTAIKITVASNRSRFAAKSLGKSRNTAVVRYLELLGVNATFTRTNTIGKGRLSTALKNNRVTVSATWTNPAS
jgi:outer membrane protein OmpA-like peptidoglycan-associated protein